MKDSTLSFNYQIREARRKSGMTQAALAAKVGCMQSAISMLETGRTDAVSIETLEKIATVFGISLPESAVPAIVPAQDPVAASGRICPDPECPSNYPYMVHGETFFLPKVHSTPGPRCPFCGEVLVTECPECGAALALPAACCTRCGKPLVNPPAFAPTPDWIADHQRLADIIAHRS